MAITSPAPYVMPCTEPRSPSKVILTLKRFYSAIITLAVVIALWQAIGSHLNPILLPTPVSIGTPLETFSARASSSAICESPSRFSLSEYR